MAILKAILEDVLTNVTSGIFGSNKYMPVRNAAGTVFNCAMTVRNAAGTEFTVSGVTRNAAGTGFAVYREA